MLAGKTAYVNSKITGTMVDRGTVNYTPTTFNQTVVGGKHSGSGVVYGDVNLVAANIRAGLSIFGVSGTYTGLVASGTVTSGNNPSNYDTNDMTNQGLYSCTVSGLTFQPKVILLYKQGAVTLYLEGSNLNQNPAIVCNIMAHLSGVQTYYVRFQNSAYVNATGFRLPVIQSNSTLNWIAYG